MSKSVSNSIGLGNCLHDGIVESLRSDLMARTFSIIVDSPFHWAFHNLPASTRFELRFEGVITLAAFSFEPWPGAVEPSPETPWNEAQSQRFADSAKGRMVSTSWNDFAVQIGRNEEHVILTAELVQGASDSLLKLGINSYPSSDYRDIEINAEQLRTFIGEREYTLTEFTHFGDAYWNDRSARTETNV
jgi:hypothetical protein